jgi:hypothetical protein
MGSKLKAAAAGCPAETHANSTRKRAGNLCGMEQQLSTLSASLIWRQVRSIEISDADFQLTETSIAAKRLGTLQWLVQED